MNTLLLSLLVFFSFSLSSISCKQPGHYLSSAFSQYSNGLDKLSLFDPHSPQQVLTSVTGKIGTIAVTYITFSSSVNTSIYWAKSPDLIFTAQGSSAAGEHYDWPDPANPSKIRTIHTALMHGLAPKQVVYYRVGDRSNSDYLSSTFKFTVPPNGQEVLNMIVYGDMGVVNSQSMQLVASEVFSGAADIVLHIGDFAYDLHTVQGVFGDIFMNEIQPISSSLPYMGCEGNHEGKYNSSHYTNRFAAYAQAANDSLSNINWWYSWDYISGGAMVHMVSISTEVYYDYVDNNQSPDLSIARRSQYQWLDRDLAAARKRGVDWIIIYGHRPMYCSNSDDLSDCFGDTNVLRNGYNGKEWGLEDLFNKYSVDLYLGAHEHSYERCFPVYKGHIDPNVDLRRTNHTYLKPQYTTHIISGSAGCQELLEPYDPVFYGPYSVVRSSTYGYGHLKIYNGTHLYWDQLLDEGKQGIDWLWLIK
jgi:hypothetical protein